MSQTIPNEDPTSYGPASQPNGGLGIVDTSGPEQGPQQPAPPLSQRIQQAGSAAAAGLVPVLDAAGNIKSYIDHGLENVGNAAIGAVNEVGQGRGWQDIYQGGQNAANAVAQSPVGQVIGQGVQSVEQSAPVQAADQYFAPGGPEATLNPGFATGYQVARGLPEGLPQVPGALHDAWNEAVQSVVDDAQTSGRRVGDAYNNASTGNGWGALANLGKAGGDVLLGALNTVASPYTLAQAGLNAAAPRVRGTVPSATLPGGIETPTFDVGLGDVAANAQLASDGVQLARSLGVGGIKLAKDISQLIQAGVRVTPDVVAALRSGTAVEKFLQRAAGAVDTGITNLQGNAARVAALDAERAGQAAAPAYATLGIVPPEPPRRRLVPVDQRAAEEARIPRAGYSSDLSSGAEEMLRNAPENAPPSQPLSRAEVARKAEEILGADPERVRAWQDEALSTPENARPVRGEALRQAQYVDAENANRAIDRLRAAQEQARAAGGSAGLAPDQASSVADALLEAAQAARAFSRSAAADTAEGRAAARQLNQRRSVILAQDAMQTAERARSVGQDAAFAANEVRRASRTGTLSDAGAQRLRIVRDKLMEAERNGIGLDDGAGGRLDQLEQRTATVQQQARAQAALSTSAPLGTRIAGDVGSSVAGGVFGAATGAALPADTPEERRRNALLGAGVGMLGAPIARRIIGRTQGGALGTLGASPLEGGRGVGATTEAFGINPENTYQMRFRVVDLGDLIPSHTDAGVPHPAFPPELQPRLRDRAGSQLQIDRIARNLNPDALLTDVRQIDRGPMIVGPDGVVESGNGRVLALRRAASQYPEQYAQYANDLKARLPEYGLKPSDVEGMQHPVLVRERMTDVNRPAFAAEANQSAVLAMSPYEQALQDARNLPADSVSQLSVGPNQSLDAAILHGDNRPFVRAFMATLPGNEQAALLDSAGNLNAQGLQRVKAALFASTYGGESGQRLTRAFFESLDPTVKNIEGALNGSLPDIARVEAGVQAGHIDSQYSIAADVSKATDAYARLKASGQSVSDYLAQADLFGNRETTPLQDALIQFMDENRRSQKPLRDLLKGYAEGVERLPPPDQVGMFGPVERAGKGELLDQALADVRANTPKEPVDGGLFTSLEQANPESAAGPHPNVGPDAAASQELARPESPREPARPAPAAPVAAPASQVAERTPAADLVPRGGPEGSLAVEGAPQPVARPGAIPENVAPRGGPEGTLAAQGAPQPTPRPGQIPEGVAPVGGPEARLRAEGAPPEAANLPPVADGAAPTGGPQGSLQAPPLGSPAEQRAVQQARIRGVVSSIDEVLANPSGPGSLERLQQLHADLQDISKAGFQRSSDLKARLQRNGLLRAGLASKTEDVSQLVDALARVDPNKPEEMRAVLNIISKPRLIDHLLEYQYVNMLSSPITQGVNITSNALQIAGRLLLTNPLEFAYSGGRSTGVGAAFEGAGRGFREGLGEAGQIMRSGISSADTQRALEMGDYGHVGREVLTEKFGRAGALLHVISTRPLAAMDALLGHVAYASAADQYAQRTADALLKNGAQSVKGLSREAARQHVLSNIWDYPDIIKQAGKIEDYTLLRSKDVEGAGWGRVERGLRQLAAVRNPAEDAGFGGQVVSFLANNILPFFNVPLNFAKQGAERTVGVPVNAVRAIRAYGAGDVERGAELASKATIGAAALATAGTLAYTGDLTGDGPTDPGQRAVWLQTHRPNSFRAPGTQTWISWDGTPFAIPFGMVAGAQEGWKEAQQSAAKKGQAEPLAAAGMATLKAGQGAASGFTSQSFVRALGDQYKLITGQDTGLATVANQATSNISRFVPASGMVNWLAQITDGMFAPGYDRDPGKPQSFSDLPRNIAAREAIRIPGLREQVDPRLDIYGQPTPNERSGLAGALPYYRGSGPRAGDAITQNLEAAGGGDVSTPSQLSIEYKGSSYGQIPLSLTERRRFSEIAGQELRRELEQAGAATATWTPDVYDKIRASAHTVAVRQMQAEIGGDEINRRLAARPQPAGVP